MTKKEFLKKCKDLPQQGWGISNLDLHSGKGYVYNSSGYGNIESYKSLDAIAEIADLSCVSFHDANGNSPVIYFN
jgi:hypothetical protein